MIIHFKIESTWGFKVRVIEFEDKFYTDVIPTPGAIHQPMIERKNLREALNKACDIAGID